MILALEFLKRKRRRVKNKTAKEQIRNINNITEKLDKQEEEER